MATTKESYYESLGRQSQMPYVNEKLLYVENEPDLTKPVNENITKEIEDTSQFFTDNINRYNQTVAGKTLDIFKSLESLVPSTGKLIAQAQVNNDNRAEYDRIKKLSLDDDVKVKYSLAGMNYDALTNANLGDLKEEQGKAEKALAQFGFYETTDLDGQSIKLYAPDIDETRQTIDGIPLANGRRTVKSMNLHYNQFVEAAKDTLYHSETGLLYDQLNYQQKAEWTDEMNSLYISMWRDKDPNLSERLLVSDFMPTVNGQVKQLYSGSVSNSSAASRDASMEATNFQGALVIQDMFKKHEEKVDGEVLMDNMFSKNGWIDRQTRLYSGQGVENPRAKANEDFVRMVKFGIDNKMLTEEMVGFILKDFKFDSTDGRKGISYYDIQDKRAIELLNYQDAKLTDEDKVRQQGLLKEYTNKYNDNNVPMTLAQLNGLWHNDVREEAANLYAISNKGKIHDPIFLEAKQGLDLAIFNRGSDKDVFKNVIYGEGAVASNRAFLSLGANKYYIKAYNAELIKLKDEGAAQTAALKLTVDKLNKGDFDSHVDDTSPTNTDTIRRQNTLIYTTDNKKALTSKEAHPGEMYYVPDAVNWFVEGGPIPAYYREFSKYYPELSAEKFMHDRLVAMNVIKPIQAYKLKTVLGLNKNSSKNLTNNIWYNKTFQTFVENADAWNQAQTRLEVPLAKENGGYGAFKGNDGEYKSEVNLQELDMFQLGDLITINPDGEFGMYGIKGKNLTQVINHLVAKGVVDPNQKFDENFQKKLLLIRLKLEANKSLSLNGDTSYLGLLEFSDQDKQDYENIVGAIPPYEHLDTLLPIVAKAKIGAL